MAFHLYILHSPTLGKFYVGHTGDDLKERLRRHYSNHGGFTGRKNDWQIVYTEKWETKQLAYAREREIKTWKSKARIKVL